MSIQTAIAEAARATGVSADFLSQAAARESGFDPRAKAKTSSAAGLFQFIESTWLKTLKTHGVALGLGDAAAKAADPTRRAEALELRFDPKTAALLAGALTNENARALENALGRRPSAGELHVAHVLGAGDAATLIATAEANPTKDAAVLFPKAAAANTNLFRAPEGGPISAQGLLARISGAAEGARAPADAPRPGSAPRPNAPAPSAGGPLLLTSTVVELLASLKAPEKAQS